MVMRFQRFNLFLIVKFLQLQGTHEFQIQFLNLLIKQTNYRDLRIRDYKAILHQLKENEFNFFKMYFFLAIHYFKEMSLIIARMRQVRQRFIWISRNSYQSIQLRKINSITNLNDQLFLSKMWESDPLYFENIFKFLSLRNCKLSVKTHLFKFQTLTLCQLFWRYICIKCRQKALHSLLKFSLNIGILIPLLSTISHIFILFIQMTEFRVFKLLDLNQTEQQMKKYGNIPPRIDIYFTHINALTKYGLKMRDCNKMQDIFTSHLLEVKRLSKKNKWKKIVQTQTEPIIIDKNLNIFQCMDKIMHILMNENQKKLAELILDLQKNRNLYRTVVVIKQQNKHQSINYIKEECLLSMPLNNNAKYLSFSAEQFKKKDILDIVLKWELEYKIDKQLILQNAKTEQVFVGSYPEFVQWKCNQI